MRSKADAWAAVLSGMVVLGLAGAAREASADETGVDLRHYLRQTWQTAEGLPQNSVRAIVQAHDGYIWFATAEGLVRFDGVRFTVFDRTSTPALAANNVDTLIESRDGSLWIGLRHGGVARMSGGAIQSWTTEQGLSGDAITTLVEARDGSVWAGTAGEGLNRLQDGHVRAYRKADGLPGEFVEAVSEAPDGSLWVATDHGLARFADDRFTTLTTRDGLPHDTVHALLHARDGRLWVGTAAGLAFVDNGRVGTLGRNRPDDPDEVMSLAEGHDGSLWIGTRAAGLKRLRRGEISTLASADGLPDDFVHAVLEDREGNIWVGQNAGGVTRLRATPFRTVSKRDGLPSEYVRAVYEGRDGSMWIATNGFGLVRMRHGEVTRLTTSDGLPNEVVTAIGETKDGALWVGTQDGLARLSDRHVSVYTKAEGLPHGNVRAFLEDSHGQVWIGTAGGVCRIDGGRCAPVPELEGYVRALVETEDGAIWAGGHLGVRRFRDGAVTAWTAKEGLSNDFVTSIVADADGVMWVGTAGGGLNRIERGRVTAYRQRDGLFDDVVYRALPDGRGWVWMTSNRGLFRVSRADLDAFAAGRSKSIRSLVYTESDGLPTSEFNGGSFPAGIVARNGNLWWPSIRGVVEVDSRGISTVSVPLPVRIEQAQIDERSYNPASALEAPPGRGRLEIQYSAPSFVAPSKIRFRYRLDGFDREWIDAGTRRVAYYTNLPPGSYRFQVVASNEAGEWPGGATTLDLTLKPHFFQTTWFAVVVGVLLALCGWGAVRLRVRQARASEQRLRALVEERTHELQEEIAERRRAEAALVEAREAALSASRLKSEFIANVSHEIRTPMNGVIGMTDLALEGPLPADVRGCLETVRSSADALLYVINDILDFSKIEAGKLDLVPLDFGLRELLDQIVALFQPRADEKGIRIDCEVDDSVPDALVADAGRLRQVLTNLVGNALKFTEQGSVRVTVQRELAAAASPLIGVRFAVVDTGIGIPPEHQARVFEPFTQVDGSNARRFGGTGLGLTISARLVRLMGGELTVSSAVGEGSTFTFTVPAGVSVGLAPRDSRRVRPAPLMRSLRVLLAEDNVVNQTVAARILEKAGHTVTVVDSGTAAVAAVERGTFDVVMMDLQMPGMNGFEATAAIRAAEAGRSRVPIIALTAHALSGDRARCLEAGMDGYVAKPVRAGELHAALAELVRSAA